MNYPVDLDVKLGFDKIKQYVKDYCVSGMGVAYAEKLAFSTNLTHVNLWLDQTREFIRVLSAGQGFPQSNYIDISAHLKQCRIPGSYLDTESLFDIKAVLETQIKVSDFFQKHGEEYPALAGKMQHINLDYGLFEHLEAKIDEKGELRDNASPELMRIREGISKSQIRARTAINKILKQASGHGYTPEDASLTIRDGRLVIPVLAEHKRHVKGFVHDESATGQTVFLEPAEALEINNEVRELKYAEKREIIRILTALTDHVRENAEELLKGLNALGLLDFIRAKAKFAIDFDSHCPVVKKHPLVSWTKARHPVLQQALKEQGKEIKPLNVELNKSDRILLISGPNAGGKSVALKTIGIIQYMLQSGMPVPVQEGSEFGMFGSLFIDIGDEQSLENDLSTYSSHLRNMKHFLGHADHRTLFLIDEFGTGTEPQFGGAIAETVLIALNKTKAYGAVTTHYGNLKKLAEQGHGIINGAMKYDVKQLEPLYELEIGKPGSSFALEIAGKIGLDKKILDQAKRKAGVSHVQFDRMLSELEQEKEQVLKEKKQIEAKSKRLAEAIKDYEDLKSYVEKQKTQVLQKAKDEAARVIKSSNKQIEATIRQIQEAKADKKRTQQARDRLKSHEQKLATGEKQPDIKLPATQTQLVSFKVGDTVRLKSSGAAGEIISIKGKQAEIALGGLTSRVKVSDLEKLSAAAFKQQSDFEKVKKVSGIDINKKMADFTQTLDIRGVRAEEAIGKVEDYMDEAILLGMQEVKILHGKGHGVLRDLVRNVLKGNRKVVSAKDEHIEHGGSGITVVTLDA